MKRRIIQIDEGLDLIRLEDGNEAIYYLKEQGCVFVLGETVAQSKKRAEAILAGIEGLESSHITAEAVS